MRKTEAALGLTVVLTLALVVGKSCEADAAPASSPIGEGVCVQLVGAIDPRTQVGMSVEGIGGYCSLSGCTLSGTLTVGTPSGGTQLYTDGFNYAAVGWFATSRTSPLTGMRFSGGSILMYLAGAVYATLSGSTGNLTLGASLVSTGFMRSVGTTFASLPTCNGGAAGSFEYATDVPCMAVCNGSAWACVPSTGGADAGTAVTSATVVTVGHLGTSVAATVDSNLNNMLAGQFTQVTARYMTGVYTAGTGTGGPIQVECTGIISGKRCFANVSCNGANSGYDGGTFFTVPFYGYSSATACSFTAGDLVYCLGRNAPQDGGTDCTLDPLLSDVVIEGTYP